MPTTNQLLDVTRIYYEPAAAELPRGRQVLDRWPDATLVPVESHWRIPELHGDETNVDRWVRIKREALVLGIKKSLSARPNGRSADFIAPSTANGCAMACAYCYVPRRKGYSNPVTVFANIEQITGYLARHVRRQGVKPEPNQCDPTSWVYDLGENSDCSVDAEISDNVDDLIATFRDLPTAKASFATKFVNHRLLGLGPQGRTRIRFSLMPARVAKLLDIRTSPVPERLAALDDATNDSTKAQLQAEVIFLTHEENLHQVNLGWHPRAEDLLWRPAMQETKRSTGGGINVRYRTGDKGRYVQQLLDLIEQHAPYLRVRYAF